MKIKISIITVILCVLCLLPIPVLAASASGSLTGPGTVRAGDTITLSFNLNGSGIFGASGTLSYDSNQVTLSGTQQSIASPWMVEFNGNNFVAYDNNLTNPINSNTTLFTVTFKVKDSVATGANIKISYSDVKASDGSADINVGTVSYSATVAAPLSGENTLSSLTVSNATISPAFSAGTTDYTAKVPFSVSKLDVSATAKDSKAKVSVDSPTLTPNGNTKVTVTVTAENGAKKYYTINVFREQDPNYVASNNNKLSGITVDGFLLSPVFTENNTRYLIWLPYETESVSVSATAADGKASVQIVGGDTLYAGQDNEIKIICTAEDGSKKEYIVVAKRAAAHDGSVEEIPDEPVDTETEATEETEVEDSQVPDTEEPSGADEVKGTSGVPAAAVVLMVILALALGVTGGYLGRNIIGEFLDKMLNR